MAAALAAGAAPVSVVLVAGSGNTLGSCVNWLLGLGIEHFRHRRWFPVKEKDLDRAQAWFQHYGVWSLLLAWMPLIGDAVTVVAGVMRVRFWLFLVLVAVGKFARYAVAAMILSGAGLGD